jgi:hypothetical protein
MDNIMKYLKFSVFLLILGLSGCYQNDKTQESVTKADTNSNLKTPDISKDKQEIQNLIRKVLKWSKSKQTIDLLPVLADSKDSIYSGFDLEKHKMNLEKLKKTNFFTPGFIENYNQIILTLDNGMRKHEFEWEVGSLPDFNFANDVDPWCLCQDWPDGKPSAWDLVEVQIINVNSEKGGLFWKWGKLDLNPDSSWKDFKYKFEVEKETGKWKISYMEGFDYKNSTSK